MLTIIFSHFTRAQFARDLPEFIPTRFYIAETYNRDTFSGGCIACRLAAAPQPGCESANYARGRGESYLYWAEDYEAARTQRETQLSTRINWYDLVLYEPILCVAQGRYSIHTDGKVMSQSEPQKAKLNDLIFHVLLLRGLQYSSQEVRFIC